MDDYPKKIYIDSESKGDDQYYFTSGENVLEHVDEDEVVVHEFIYNRTLKVKRTIVEEEMA